MKKNFSEIAGICLLLLAITMGSCRKDERTSVQLEADQTSLSAMPAGQTFTIHITANVEWKILIPSAASDWITADVMTGTGNHAVNITVSANATGADRSAELKLEPLNASSLLKTITLGQRSFSFDQGFSKAFGGSNTEYAVQTIRIDDGFILTGLTYSADGDFPAGAPADIWVVKTDDQGAIVWKTVFGGNSSDQVSAITRTSDNGFMLVATTGSTDINPDGTVFHGSTDVLVIKLNGNGGVEWKKTFGGTLRDEARHVLATPDGSYLVVGDTYSTDGDIDGSLTRGFDDMWAIKLQLDGSVIWKRTFGGSGADRAMTAVITSDGKYMIGGNSSSLDGDFAGMNKYGNSMDIVLMKLNPSTGAIEWKEKYGGRGADFLNYNQALIMVADGMVIAGNTTSSDGDLAGTHSKGNEDGWIFKINTDGNMVWKKRLGGSGEDYLYSVAATTAGYLVGGYTESSDGDIEDFKGDADGWLIRLNTEGELQLKQTWGGAGNDCITSILPLANGFLLAGWAGSEFPGLTGYHAGSDAWLIKLSEKE